MNQKITIKTMLAIFPILLSILTKQSTSNWPHFTAVKLGTESPIV